MNWAWWRRGGSGGGFAGVGGSAAAGVGGAAALVCIEEMGDGSGRSSGAAGWGITLVLTCLGRAYNCPYSPQLAHYIVDTFPISANN
jgi:hypothetical protein